MYARAGSRIDAEVFPAVLKALEQNATSKTALRVTCTTIADVAIQRQKLVELGVLPLLFKVINELGSSVRHALLYRRLKIVRFHRKRRRSKGCWSILGRLSRLSAEAVRALLTLAGQLVSVCSHRQGVGANR